MTPWHKPKTHPLAERVLSLRGDGDTYMKEAGHSGSEFEDLRRKLERAWSLETSANPEHWASERPSCGQCAVTALIIQDLFGGDLLRCKVEETSHYWNRLPSRQEIDLTRDQFGSSFLPQNVELRSRDYVLSFPDTRKRYEILKDNLLTIKTRIP
jgi:hypothetical protein